MHEIGILDGCAYKARSDQRGLVDRRLVMLVEVAPQPSSGNPRVSPRILARDQLRQLERLAEGEPANLLRGRLGYEKVAALERSPEDRPRVALRSRRSSSPGPRTASGV